MGGITAFLLALLPDFEVWRCSVDTVPCLGCSSWGFVLWFRLKFVVLWLKSSTYWLMQGLVVSVSGVAKALVLLVTTSWGLCSGRLVSIWLLPWRFWLILRCFGWWPVGQMWAIWGRLWFCSSEWQTFLGRSQRIRSLRERSVHLSVHNSFRVPS